MAKYDFNLEKIEKTLRLKTWWAALCILPLARRLALFIANYTDLKPNTITFISFTLKLLSASLFIKGAHALLVIGAFIFELSYCFDCVDGSIARLKKQESTTGEFIDHVTDVFGVTLNIIALAYGAKILFTPIAFFVLSMYLFLHYVTFVANDILDKERSRLGERSRIALNMENFTGKIRQPFLGTILKCRSFFSNRNFKAFLSLPDFEAVICFIFPLAGNVALGFTVGAALLVILLFYKIFSYLTVIKANAELK